MQTDKLVDINELCVSYNIEFSLVSSLQDNGLIELITVDDNWFIEQEQLYLLERCISLHYDLDINLEGIETINYLLEKISSLQEEVVELKNRLRLYEKI
jgi:chaperone modulatory protein CbpM